MSQLGLVMIARDAELELPRCLRSVRKLISRWCIVDTGSTDDTRKVALKELHPIPGRYLHRPWRSFAENRTEALELASGILETDYMLMLDADHEVTIHSPLPELELDSYLVPIDDSWGGSLPLVTRTGHPFRYKGVAHAYLTCDGPVREGTLAAISVRGGPGASPEKLERDRVALELAFLEEPTPRTVFYLAQTYRDLDRWDEAILFYRMRAEMGGFEEERFVARWQLGVLLGENVSFAEGAEELLRAWRERPHRVEPLRALANLAGSVADKYPVPDDTLFVQRGLYRQEEAS